MRKNMANYFPSVILYFLLCFNRISTSFVTVEEEVRDHILDGDIHGFAHSLFPDRSGRGLPGPGAGYARWPRNLIPYEFNPDYPRDLRRVFEKATRHISQKTCIKFKRRTNERDYLRVKEGQGCYTYIGHVVGGQDVVLSRECYRDNKIGVFVHELLHDIGMEHEQMRRDRDRYINIHWSNIPPRLYPQFDKSRSRNPTTFPYDYKSIMHYSKYAGSRFPGEPSMTPKQAGILDMGQINGMSKIDIEEVNALFCGKKETKKGRKKGNQWRMRH